VENIPYRNNFRIIIISIHKILSSQKSLSWILCGLCELMLFYERIALIWVQIEFKLLLKRIYTTLKGPTMMIPTKIKLIKSKIDSAILLRNMEHFYTTIFLILHLYTIYILKRWLLAIIILSHCYTLSEIRLVV